MPNSTWKFISNYKSVFIAVGFSRFYVLSFAFINSDGSVRRSINLTSFQSRGCNINIKMFAKQILKNNSFFKTLKCLLKEAAWRVRAGSGFIKTICQTLNDDHLSFVRSFVRWFLCSFLRSPHSHSSVKLHQTKHRQCLCLKNEEQIFHPSFFAVCVCVDGECVCVCTSPSFLAVLSFMLIGIMCVCVCVCVCVCICVYVYVLRSMVHLQAMFVRQYQCKSLERTLHALSNPLRLWYFEIIAIVKTFFK